ncbi:MAG TPA: dephospho-CoA kinase [Steroidobacteraceae bacterium]|nr:dephospho-CoA kinase [Steroidobacteraceae bacterium]
MLIVGLTGGIASGKSTVAREFQTLGVPVIDADVVSRELMTAGSPLLQQVLTRFETPVRERYGASLRSADGTLDRKLLRRLIFEDARERDALEEMTHPAIRERMRSLSSQMGGAYQIHVIPLLVENQAASRVDRVLVVDCPQALQLQRLQVRDGADEAQARALLAAQASRAARLAHADDVITNDADAAALAPQVQALHRKYLTLAAPRTAR